MERNATSRADRGVIARRAAVGAGTVPAFACMLLLALAATGCPARPAPDAGTADRPAAPTEGGQVSPPGAALSVTGGEPVVYD